MVRKITFKIDQHGEVRLEVDGAQGAECLDLTEAFEEVLGTVSQREHKDTFFSSTEREHQWTGSQS